MKRQIKLLILLLIIIALITAYITIKSINEKKAESQNDDLTETINIPTVDKKDIVGLEWNYKNETVSFEYKDAKWAYKKDDQIPLDATYLDLMVDQITQIEAKGVIETPDNVNQYGFTAPVVKIALTTKDGSIASYKIGNQNEITQDYYLFIGDSKEKVYLVDEELVNTFAVKLMDVVKKETVPSIKTMRKISVTADNKVIVLANYDEGSSKAYTDEYNWYLETEQEVLPLSYKKVDTLINEVREMPIGNCVSYNLTNDEIKAFGFNSPSAVIEFTYEDEKDSDNKQIAYEIGQKADDYNVYMRIKNSSMAYVIDSQLIDKFIDLEYSSYRPDEVIKLNTAKIKKIKGEFEDKTIEVDVEKDEQGDICFVDKGRKIAKAKSNIFLQLINKISVVEKEFKEDAASDNNIARFEFELDSAEYPYIELIINEYDESNYAAYFNDETLLVPKDEINKIRVVFNELFE